MRCVPVDEGWEDQRGPRETKKQEGAGWLEVERSARWRAGTQGINRGMKRRFACSPQLFQNPIWRAAARAAAGARATRVASSMQRGDGHFDGLSLGLCSPNGGGLWLGPTVTGETIHGLVDARPGGDRARPDQTGAGWSIRQSLSPAPRRWRDDGAPLGRREREALVAAWDAGQAKEGKATPTTIVEMNCSFFSPRST